MSVPHLRRLRAATVVTVLATGLATVSVVLPPTAATAAPGGAASVQPSTPAVSTVTVGGLEVENSFVSSVGWVKPGDTYPSRIIVSNPADPADPTNLPVAGATVIVTAPEGSTISAARPGATVSPGGRTVTWPVPPVAAGKSQTLVLESAADRPGPTPRSCGATSPAWRRSPSAPRQDRDQPRTQGDPAVGDLRHGAVRRPPVPGRPGAVHRPQLPGHHGAATSTRSSTTRPSTGSTYNLYQEMSLGQLFPKGTVPSDGAGAEDFTYAPGFAFTKSSPADLPRRDVGTRRSPARAPRLPRAHHQRRLQPARQHRLLR